MRPMKRWSRRLRAVLRKDAVERELDEEMAFHLELEVQKNLRAGMTPAEARRQAALTFGAVERFKEEVRDARTLGWVTGLSLDTRLGARMLLKHPGLTLVGGLGMAVAIAIAVVFDATMGAASAPLPIPGGERVVALEVWDAEINNQEEQILHDFGGWRETARSVEALGAYRSLTRTLVVPGGSAEPTLLAEMTANGFAIAGTPPLLGRPLVESDEAADAPPVAVIGHGLWQSRFGGDPGVVGRQVRLGTVSHTVVGVMPEGFGFPLNHPLWVPLRLDPASHAPREGPSVFVFGRLVPGVTIEEAGAELAALGDRLAAASPGTHRHLRPRVIQYGPHLNDDMQGWELPVMRALVTLLLVIIAVNVAALVFARTAARAGEIAVRSALGASRRRIVTQFFAEGLLLAGVSAALGLGIAAVALRQIDRLIDALLSHMGGLPYWLEFRLSPRAVAFAVGLAVLAAAIVGVLPALRATGSRLESALRALGGATEMRLGRMWSLLIVGQVAFTVAILPATVAYSVDFARYWMRDPGFAAEEYLTTDVGMSAETEAPVPPGATERDLFVARYAARVAELKTRLDTEPEVLGSTLSVGLPGQEPTVRFEVEGASAGTETSHVANYARVDDGFFATFALPLLRGRGFAPGDLGPAATPVVVNQAFVREALGGGAALGRRIRVTEGYRSGGVTRVPGGLEADRWYEVVGVVGDLPARATEPGQPTARVYRPLDTAGTYPLSLSIHTRGEPGAFAPRVRELAAAVDPTLQARDLQPMDVLFATVRSGMRIGALSLGLLTGSVLLLSAAGIYAMMSFTVTQRRREIGIRRALGARPRRIVAGVLRRATTQLGIGAGIGMGLAVAVNLLSRGEMTGGAGHLVLPAVAAIILVVGLLATFGPARRGLGVEPMEALREQ